MAGDDGYVDALGVELGGVRVAEAMGVDALVDAGPGGQAFEHDANVGGGGGVQADGARSPAFAIEHATAQAPGNEARASRCGIRS